MSDALRYAITLDSATAVAALERFNLTAGRLDHGLLQTGRAATAAGSQTSLFAGSVGVMAAGAVVATAALAALAAAAKGLSLAAEFEQTNIAFKTLTGSAETAKQVIQDIGDLAIETPFSEKDLQGAAKSMLAARVPAAALKGELTTMGNIAAATGGDIGRLSNVYSQVAGKGKLYAEELQQFVEQGAGEIRQAVAEELGVTTAELNDMMAAGKVGFSTLQGALTRLAGAGGKWGHGMADQSKTTLGLLSSLQGAVSKVLRLLMQPVNDGPIRAFLTTAVEVATKAASVIQNAIAKGKVGETLKQSLILGAKLGVNATVNFIASIPGKIKSALAAVGRALAAALTGGADAAMDILGSFNTNTLNFDTSKQETYFKSLTEGAKTATKAIEETNDWAKALDATTADKDSKNKSGENVGPTDDERRKKAQDMAQNRNDIMGEIAQLKALAAGRKGAADEIERELRIQKDKLDLMRQTGASEEEALRLAKQKANLEDRVAGKRAKIGGVTSEKYMDERPGGPLSNNGPLTEGGGIDGFYRLQQTPSYRREKSLIPGNKFMEPRTVFVPGFAGSLSGRDRKTSDVAGLVNTAAAAPAAAARNAASASQPQTADPVIAELQKIHAELARIRTA